MLVFVSLVNDSFHQRAFQEQLSKEKMLSKDCNFFPLRVDPN